MRLGGGWEWGGVYGKYVIVSDVQRTGIPFRHTAHRPEFAVPGILYLISQQGSWNYVQSPLHIPVMSTRCVRGSCSYLRRIFCHRSKTDI